MLIQDYIVVEYSISQNCFHIEPLSQLLEINKANAVKKKINDYQIIGIFKTKTEAQIFIVGMEALIKQKQKI